MSTNKENEDSKGKSDKITIIMKYYQRPKK
jgi:hypothetical protein